MYEAATIRRQITKNGRRGVEGESSQESDDDTTDAESISQFDPWRPHIYGMQHHNTDSMYFEEQYNNPYDVRGMTNYDRDVGGTYTSNDDSESDPDVQHLIP